MTRGLLMLLLGFAVGGAADAQIRSTLVASGFDRPVAMIAHPTVAGAFVVVEQWGRVRVLRNGTAQGPDFLNLTGEVAISGEQGVLGLAFAPNYATSRRVFVSFTNRQGHSVISRYLTASGDPLRTEPSTRVDLRWPDGQRFITQPFVNHNGGQITFGPDGLLYFGLGDGGGADDPFHNAQNLATLLGKMLRLDVSVPDSDPEGYDVPPTNPFVGRAGALGEIWALGLRNPWRWSFDDPQRAGTGALIIGDVGQGAWEEVSYQPPGTGGLNYGWRNREGAHSYITSQPPAVTPLEDPIWEYPTTSAGRSVIGGYVYRGRALGSGFVGRYFVADYVYSRVWSLQLSVNGATRRATVASVTEHTTELGAAAVSPSSFAVGPDGELYIVTLVGSIYRIDPLPGQEPAPDPTPTPTPTPTPPGDGARRAGPDGKGSARPR